MSSKPIYTKTGDTGETQLGPNERVAKDDIRIEANGQLDELSSLLGVVVSLCPQDDPVVDMVRGVQRRLMEIMAHIAGRMTGDRLRALAEDSRSIEQEIDRRMGDEPFRFLLPGDSTLTALWHLARSKARTCERRLWTLHRQHPLPSEVMAYVNRLSDLFYAFSVG